MPRRQLVAAIDFGTTYSGYAYAYFSDLKNNPLKIHAYTWSNETNLRTIKTPTTILFDKDGNFHSFGYEAEMKYDRLSAEENHVGWRYFRRFKLELYQKEKRLRRALKLYDAQGRAMPALDVFGAAIRYLKDHALTNIRNRAHDFKDTDINWVLTVPAIWEDGAKQFMSLAAEKAGIPANQLLLAYEPEAAAIYCERLELEVARQYGTGEGQNDLQPGSKFILIDLGGGTVDIAAYEMKDKGFLCSLSAPSGGPWGGTMVDKEFRSFLETLFGKEVLQSMCTSDSLDMEHAIEFTKRAMANDKEDVSFKPPTKLNAEFDKLYNSKSESEANNVEPCRRYSSDEVWKVRDRILIGKTAFKSMFKLSIDKISSHVDTVLNQPNLQGVKTILLVGGYAESDIMQQAMKDKFCPRYNVVIPEDAGLSILKGAVIYGQNPEIVTSRRLAFSYGISTDIPFDKERHSHDRLVIRNGKQMCENVFEVFVRKGDVLNKDITVERPVKAPHIGSTDIRVDVYKSGNDTPPMYTSDCEKVGELSLTLQSPSTSEQVLINVQMSFGGTKVQVAANECNHASNTVTAEFDWLM